MAAKESGPVSVASYRAGGGKGEPADVKMRLLTRVAHPEFGTPEPGDVVTVRESVAKWLVKFRNAERVSKGAED